MQPANILIALTLLASLACSELDVTTLGSEARELQTPNDAQQRMRADELKAESFTKSAGVDGRQAIESAETKEVAHKSRTPQERALHASKTPLSNDIAVSHERERKIKAQKIKKEELASKELKAKQEKEAKKIAAAKAAEAKAKESQSKAQEKADKEAAKALAEKNEQKQKADAAAEKVAKQKAAEAKELSDKQAAKLAVEQEAAAKSKEKQDKVAAKEAKLLKDKADAERTLIDGPKQIEAAQAKISKAKDTLAHLYATSPEGIAEAKEKKEVNEKEKNAKEAETKEKTKKAEAAAREKAAKDKELAEKAAEKRAKIEEKEAKAEAARQKAAEKAKKIEEEKAQEIAEKAAAAAEKERGEKDKKKAREAKIAKQKETAEKAQENSEKELLLAAEKKKKAAEMKSNEEAEKGAQQKVAAEASEKKKALEAAAAEAKKAEAELQAKHEEELRAEKDAQDKEAEQAEKKAMSVQQRKLAEQAAQEKESKKEAELQVKHDSAMKKKKKQALAMKMKAQEDKLRHFEEQQEKQDAAAEAQADRAAKEKSTKESAKAAYAVKEGDDKRRNKIAMDAANEKGEKAAAEVRLHLAKKAKAKVMKLKSELKVSQERDMKDKQILTKRKKNIANAQQNERVVKVKKRRADEEAYLAMMNSPSKMIGHLDHLTKQWMENEVQAASEVKAEGEEANVLDTLVIDLRQALDQGDATALHEKAMQAYRDQKAEILRKSRLERNSLKLKLRTEATVNQLRALGNQDPESAPLIKGALQKFFNARQTIDKVVVMSHQMQKSEEMQNAKELVVTQSNAKAKRSEQEKKEEEELAKKDPKAAAEMAKEDEQEAKEKPEAEISVQDRFRNMVASLHSLVGNWDSAVQSPPPEDPEDAEDVDGVEGVNSNSTATELSAEELAARAAAQYDAERQQAMSKEQADIAAAAAAKKAGADGASNDPDKPKIDIPTELLKKEGREMEIETAANAPPADTVSATALAGGNDQGGKSSSPASPDLAAVTPIDA